MRKSKFTESQTVTILKEGEAGVALSELTRKQQLIEDFLMDVRRVRGES